MSQSVCPWNVRFAQELTEPAFTAHEFLAGKDARQLARDLLGMPQEEFSRAFKGSPMKRAKLRGLERNAAVVLGNVGAAEDVDVLTRALDDPEPLVREHAAWALEAIGARRWSPRAPGSVPVRLVRAARRASPSTPSAAGLRRSPFGLAGTGRTRDGGDRLLAAMLDGAPSPGAHAPATTLEAAAVPC